MTQPRCPNCDYWSMIGPMDLLYVPVSPKVYVCPKCHTFLEAGEEE